MAALRDANADLHTTWGERLQSLFGMAVILGICYGISNNRKRISWRLVGWGMGLQLILGVLVLKTGPGRALFRWANDVITGLLGFTEKGASFLFGNLAVQNNMPVGPGGPHGPVQAAGSMAEVGAFFAFGVLPTIIFFSSLMAVLYHLGVMTLVVKGIAWVMQRTMGTSGSETLSASGNIFVGQTEAPLLVRPFVKGMTESELMAIMTGGFATVAGGVMAAYVGFLQASFSDIAGHLLAASVMSAPAALVCAKLMIPEPEPEKSETFGQLKVTLEKVDANVIDAAARGAGDGLKLALNVGAMLLAFIALIAMVNHVIGWSCALVGAEGVTLQGILGTLLAPLAWLMGTPWQDCSSVGQLIGVKTIMNEFVAFIDLSGMVNDTTKLTHPRSVIIATYALCGFANFSSIAIQIGGIGGIAPERRSDLAKLGLRAMIAGSFACFLTATVAGLLV
ncbi:MAG: NupC/NupG family nucleoside CNT transporter [Planctomycetes bacterium]|nr:NupC/NupG family nucleoside CNT transporter [Planctomycetota bacterium]